MKMYRYIAHKMLAIHNCMKTDNHLWITRHNKDLEKVLGAHLPSGAGVEDCAFVHHKSNFEKLVFTLSFHHMNEAGYYNGYTEHEIIIKPSLVFEFNIHITGRDRHDIKEYLHQLFYHFLHTDVDDEKRSDPQNLPG